jgi:hypothetical protein
VGIDTHLLSSLNEEQSFPSFIFHLQKHVSWQTRAATGFDHNQFTIDWQTQ